MKIEQYVMAYGIEQDRIRAIIPEEFVSLRPVLRINAEIRGNSAGYLEFNTPVEKDGNRGWLNIGYWNEVPFQKEGKTTTFKTDFIEISFTAVGIEGSCPAEKDNAGCYFLKETPDFVNVYSVGNSRIRMHMASVSVKLFRSIRKSQKQTIQGKTSQQKMQPKFHADRCWEHIK